MKLKKYETSSYFVKMFRSGQLKNFAHYNLERIFLKKVDDEKEEEEASVNFLVLTWKSFAKQTSFHGVHYLVETSINIFERFLWFLALSIASGGMIYTCMLLSQRFNSSLLSTVFESTNYKVSLIPFPAISICNNNRLNYSKIDETLLKFCGTCNKSEIAKAKKFLHIFQNLEYGSYDEFAVFTIDEIKSLKSWNITEVYEFMMHDCNQFFKECEWKDEKFNCCDNFIKQKTEYGICWSFNSASNLRDYNNADSPMNGSELKVSKSGLKSALRVKLQTFPSTSIDRSKYANDNEGIMIVIQHRFEWPKNGMFLSAGSKSSLIIKPTVFSTSDDVKKLNPLRRQCYYEHESKDYNLMHLEGLPYLRSNCMSECRQVHHMKFCNCSMGIFFPTGNYTECNADDLMCLIGYNDALNAEKSQTKNEFFDDDEPGIECSCLPECTRIDYNIEMRPIYEEKLIEENSVLVDVHYASETAVKYRTDVTFSEMDLIVGFGGIVSLFLGSSIISLVEIIYFLSIGLFYQYKRNRKIMFKKLKQKFPYLN